MKLSIIVPFYNVEKFLSDCLESIVKLTGFEREIILINDGSSDSSLKIAKEYMKRYNIGKKPEIILVEQENKGVAIARNEGIRRSTGEYIYFLDSDDWIETSSFNSLVLKFFEENDRLKEEERIDVLLGKEIFYDERTKKEKILKNIPDSYLNKVISGKEFLVSSIVKRFWNVRLPIGIYKRKTIIEHGIYFSDVTKSHEDELFMTKMLYFSNKVKTVDKVFGYYRGRDGSIMSELKIQHVIDILHNIDELKEMFKEERDVQVKSAVFGNIRRYYKEVLKKAYILEKMETFEKIYTQFRTDCKNYLFKMTKNPFEKLEIYLIYYLKDVYYNIKIGTRKMRNLMK